MPAVPFDAACGLIEAALAGDARREFFAPGRPRIVGDHLGAVAARGLELHRRRVQRHDDDGLHAEERSRQGHRLSVIA